MAFWMLTDSESMRVDRGIINILTKTKPWVKYSAQRPKLAQILRSQKPGWSNLVAALNQQRCQLSKPKHFLIKPYLLWRALVAEKFAEDFAKTLSFAYYFKYFFAPFWCLRRPDDQAGVTTVTLRNSGSGNPRWGLCQALPLKCISINSAPWRQFSLLASLPRSLICQFCDKRLIHQISM